MTSARATGLVLVGASGLARETMNLVRAIDDSVVMSVVDDNPATWGRDLGGVPVVGGLDQLQAREGDLVVVCVGRGTLRRNLVERTRRLGVTRDRFATLIHPDIAVPTDCHFGVGTIAMAGVVLTADVSVGDHVVLMPHVTLTHGNDVGNFATLCAGVSLGGDVVVGPGSYVGMNACVRERVRIGRDATVGMGAVLLSDLDDSQTWVGNPAHPLSTRLEAAR